MVEGTPSCCEGREVRGGRREGRREGKGGEGKGKEKEEKG